MTASDDMIPTSVWDRIRKRRLGGRVYDAWYSLEEPRWITAIHLVIYLITTAVGVMAVIHPPGSLALVWGDGMASAWAVTVTVGGVLAFSGCFKGHWWLESRGIWTMWLALGLRIGLVLWWGSYHDGSLFLQEAELVILSLFLLARYVRIKISRSTPERCHTVILLPLEVEPISSVTQLLLALGVGGILTKLVEGIVDHFKGTHDRESARIQAIIDARDKAERERDEADLRRRIITEYAHRQRIQLIEAGVPPEPFPQRHPNHTNEENI